MIYKRFFWVLFFILSLFVFSGCSNNSDVTISLYNPSGEIVKIKKENITILPQPLQEGYLFEGWYLDQKFQNPCTQETLKKLSKDIILYPKWTPINYVINLYDQDKLLVTLTARYGQAVYLRDYCGLDGYKLAGYVSYKNDQEFLYHEGFLMPACDLDLVVKKTPIKVYFETSGGGKIDALNYNDLKQNALPQPAKIGCKFDGWFLDAGCQNAFDLNNFYPQDDFTLYAKWTPVYYKAEFIDGEDVRSIYFQEGSVLEQPAPPQKNGYKFLGWFAGDQKFDFSQPVFSDIVLKAKYEPVIYKIKYNLDGGFSKDSLIESFSVDSSDIVLPELFKPGYKFLGWQDDQGNVIEIIPADSCKDWELWARWREKKLEYIEIINYPYKLDYFVGEKLDLDGLAIKAHYDNGETEIIDHNNPNITVYGHTDSLGKRKITINYLNVSADFYIRVLEIAITKIEAICSKNEYIEGQALDFESVKIKVFYNNGFTDIIDLKPQYLKDYDMTKTGVQKITIEFMGFVTYFEITIKAKSLISIEIEEFQAEYLYGEELNTKIVLSLLYDNGKVETKTLENAAIQGYDKFKPGSQKLTLIYKWNGQSFSCGFYVTVLCPPKTIKEITLLSYPKTEYITGEDLDTSGGQILVKYLYDDFYEDQIIPLEAYMVRGFDSSVPAQNLKLTVIYEDASCEYIINVKENLAEDDIDFSEIFIFIETELGYEIIGLKDGCLKNSVIIPSEYNGKPVTRIQSMAFLGQVGINEIIIMPRTYILTVETSIIEISYDLTFYVYCGEDKVVFLDLSLIDLGKVIF
ncbi:MAG TPA: InlB B-repeat-containing protein [Clostridia bacterium]